MGVMHPSDLSTWLHRGLRLTPGNLTKLRGVARNARRATEEPLLAEPEQRAAEEAGLSRFVMPLGLADHVISKGVQQRGRGTWPPQVVREAAWAARGNTLVCWLSPEQR